MTAEDIVRNLPKALFNWYDFKTEARVLFISGGDKECEVIFDGFLGKEIKVSKVDVQTLEKKDGEKYDYIVAAGILERVKSLTALLAKIYSMLKPCGRLLIGAENRLGIRYFCGDKDNFTHHVLDGIDNYRRVSWKGKELAGGRLYAKSELKALFTEAGFCNLKFYSVMPCLVRPQMIISESYLPKEPIEVRIFPQYNSPQTIYLEEEKLYQTLMDNNMFHQMANAFLIECSVEGTVSDIDQVTVQGDRNCEEAMATIIRYKKNVIKKPLYQEGQNKIKRLKENDDYLKQHSVLMVDAYIKDDLYVMPYLDEPIATQYFREILRQDKMLFIAKLEEFRQIILKSSEHIPYEQVNWRQFEPGWEKRKKDDPNIDRWKKLAFGTENERCNIGVILERGYIDMVSLNCFYTSQGFRFFDQEFYIESFPANAILIRTIDLIYREGGMEALYSRDEVLKYFGLYEHRGTWRALANEFLIKLRNEKELSVYHRLHRRVGKTIYENRYRMNYPQEEYERLFTNIFKDAGNRRLYIFGSGNYAKRFINQFGKFYEITGILDNNIEKWGKELAGIRIYPPADLDNEKAPFKVFICIKFFEEVLVQLVEMGIENISVYNPELDYERPICLKRRLEDDVIKPYHVGYIAGVFDLFHIGHLNLFRRAKEQCDYLIVGVVTDKQVINTKKTRPYIPFEDRLAIVQSCRYVDEAVEIPADKPGTEEAFYRYHFDVQFSGSDYAQNPYWMAKKVFLRQHGSDLVFFPYTETTSSTEIKACLSGRERSQT